MACHADTAGGKHSQTGQCQLGERRHTELSGTAGYLSPNVDLNTGTLNIRARLDNPKGILKSGLYVSITLPYGKQKNAYPHT